MIARHSQSQSESQSDNVNDPHPIPALGLTWTGGNKSVTRMPLALLLSMILIVMELPHLYYRF